MTIPLTAKWYKKSLLRFINQMHVGSTDLFPHEGIVKLGGSRILGRTALTEKLRSIIQDAIKIVRRCGIERENDIIQTFNLANGFISVIDLAKQDKSLDANNAARCLYLICVVAWHFCSKYGDGLGVKAECTLVPFDEALQYSTVGHYWSSDLAEMNKLLENNLRKLQNQAKNISAIL